ncbi:uncharacterized protein [Pleurodeles waltl]|uniref:uncharacterized protein isoform X6 n=1 Tax=Pleurodeles waltl TaxID=8319 RepID=UPI0037098228
MDNSGSDRRPIGDNSPKEEFNIMMVSDSIKEEEGAYAMADQCSEEVRNTLCPTEEFNTVMVSDSIKEEREALPIADPCSEEVKIASCPAEEEFNIVMVSDSIKEEREACPMTDQCSEDVKNTFCLAVTEEEFSTVMVSDSIKEEREACPMAEQCAEEVKYSFCPAEDDGSTGDMPVLDFPDDMDDELTNSQQTLQDVLRTLQTPPSVARRSTDTAAITEHPSTTPIVQPASSNPAEDSDTGTSFERTVVGVQRELAKEVRVGMQNMAASLEGVRLCMMSTAEQAAAMQGRTSILQELQESVKEISTAVRELTQRLQQQIFQHVHKCNIDPPLRADLVAYYSDVAAILKNQQLLLAAVLPLIALQLAATGISDSTSSDTEVCVAPSNPPPPWAEETTHTSEDEDLEPITFTHKGTQ